MDKLKSKRFTKKRAISAAMSYCNGNALASIGISALASPDCTRSPDMQILDQEIEKAVSEAKLGDLSGSEAILTSQVKVLNFLFTRLLLDAATASNPDFFKARMDLALRAQNQSRKNILALHALKNPQYTATFVKQQNVAVNQQVNNGFVTESQKIKHEIELLEESEDGARMDRKTTIKTVKINSPVEALATFNRSEDAERQREEQLKRA